MSAEKKTNGGAANADVGTKQSFRDFLATLDHAGELRRIAKPVDPRAFSTLIAQAVVAETGVEPELSTTGGTSDARFLRALCPVVEFGLCNATMHKKDEAVAVEDLRVLTRIYRRIALAALARPQA